MRWRARAGVVLIGWVVGCSASDAEPTAPAAGALAAAPSTRGNFRQRWWRATHSGSRAFGLPAVLTQSTRPGTFKKTHAAAEWRPSSTRMASASRFASLAAPGVRGHALSVARRSLRSARAWEVPCDAIKDVEPARKRPPSWTASFGRTCGAASTSLLRRRREVSGIRSGLHPAPRRVQSGSRGRVSMPYESWKVATGWS